MSKTNYGHTPTQKEIKEYLYREKKVEAAKTVAKADILYKCYGFVLEGKISVFKRYRLKPKDEPYKALSND